MDSVTRSPNVQFDIVGGSDGLTVTAARGGGEFELTLGGQPATPRRLVISMAHTAEVHQGRKDFRVLYPAIFIDVGRPDRLKDF